MNKFERLIEYVINDEDKKAKNLFHKIVVEKSRNIYEGLMDDDRIGGDQVDELLNDVEADEIGMREDDDEMGMDMEVGDDEMGMDMEVGDDEMGMGDMEMGMGVDAEEGDLEDRIVDVEDQLDRLMAEFDEIVGDDSMGDEMEVDAEADFEADDDMGGEMEVDAEMGMDDEMEESRNNMQFESEELDEDDDVEDMADDELEESLRNELEEAVALTKVSKGIANKTEGQSVGSASEQGVNVNKKTINNDNSGKKGAMANPVNFTSTEHSNNKKISFKAGDSTTEPRQTNVKMPKTSEEGGTDKKSVIESKKRRGRPLGSKNKKSTSRRRV